MQDDETETGDVDMRGDKGGRLDARDYPSIIVLQLSYSDDQLLCPRTRKMNKRIDSSDTSMH